MKKYLLVALLVVFPSITHATTVFSPLDVPTNDTLMTASCDVGETLVMFYAAGSRFDMACDSGSSYSETWGDRFGTSEEPQVFAVLVTDPDDPEFGAECDSGTVTSCRASTAYIGEFGELAYMQEGVAEAIANPAAAAFINTVGENAGANLPSVAILGGGLIGLGLLTRYVARWVGRK